MTGTGTAAVHWRDPASSADPPASPPRGWLGERLSDGPMLLDDLVDAPADELLPAHVDLQRLWSDRCLELLDRADDPGLRCTPGLGGRRLPLTGPPDGTRFRLSRFAHLRHDGTGTVLWESPRSPARVRVDGITAAGCAVVLAAPVDATELAAALPDVTPARATALLVLLSVAGLALPCDDDGRTEEDRDPRQLQWEFHDLLFHVRSRQGRHGYPVGAQFRWKDTLDPQPAVPDNPWEALGRPLPRPDLREVAAHDPSFTTVLETRRSGRSHHPARPIELAHLAEFLFRSARVRGRADTQFGEITSRPYPSGGASYELEIFVTVNACLGLARGFYYYDAVHHALCPVSEPVPDMEGLLDDAWQSAAFQCRPQVLLTVGSRFHRVGWKYSSIAYATQLKNVGVLVQTFYLVATAMGLAGSALGLGNIERYARLTGRDPFAEGSVGEFMLGFPAPGG